MSESAAETRKVITRQEDTAKAIRDADIHKMADGAPPEPDSARGRGGRVLRSIGSAKEKDELGRSGPGSRDTHLRGPSDDEAETDAAAGDTGLKDGLEAQELAAEGVGSPGSRGKSRARGLGRAGRSPGGRGTGPRGRT
jgi:hypothetical protein